MTWGYVMNWRKARIGLAVFTATASITLGACSSGEGASQASPTAPSQASLPGSTTAVADPADTAKQLAIAAYLGMWSDMAEAATTSDWQSSKLARNATAEALSKMSRGLYADRYNGLVTKGKPENSPQVESVEPADNPTTVNIVDCGDDSHWLKYRIDNGQPAEDGPGGRRHINAMVKKAVDGSWKVTDFAIQDVGTC
ncbi:hypothetical protein L1857_26190 [Amycolatopsis thermalba]|uniref:Secreted protein/lipoprotein n=1 Tax=Amycolatopsis thermalba TaxID=944492 RepID=A0ABY4P1F7_9PSEU|nr:MULTISPECIES: hypothetical protein [Amycolatopsis]UQS26053.1 hypothetical protein L1857_26190 [Amycolatopsis thermalba]